MKIIQLFGISAFASLAFLGSCKPKGTETAVSGDAAEKVYVAPGKYDEVYNFVSGGFNGQMNVYGLPSGRLLKVVPIFSVNPENGYGFSEETKPMLETSHGFIPWDDQHHLELSQTNGEQDGRWIFANANNTPRVARVNLKTFSLLYDIRMKSPALDIKEGVFYNGIPNYSIKVNKKLDEVRLNDIIIYNHSEGQGNINVIMADSGRMEPFFNDNYMKLTLYHGVSYEESRSQRGINEKPVDLSRTTFSENQIVFDLASFQLNRTPEE